MWLTNLQTIFVLDIPVFTPSSFARLVKKLFMKELPEMHVPQISYETKLRTNMLSRISKVSTRILSLRLSQIWRFKQDTFHQWDTLSHLYLLGIYHSRSAFFTTNLRNVLSFFQASYDANLRKIPKAQKSRYPEESNGWIPKMMGLGKR